MTGYIQAKDDAICIGNPRTERDACAKVALKIKKALYMNDLFLITSYNFKDLATA